MRFFEGAPGAVLVCGIAGPVAALATGWLVAPLVLGTTMQLTPGADPLTSLVENLGQTLVGVMIAALVVLALMTFIGVVSTVAALVATRCPRPGIAVVACLVLTPLWLRVVELWSPGLVTTTLSLGLVPALVRAVFAGLGARGPA